MIAGLDSALTVLEDPLAADLRSLRVLSANEKAARVKEAGRLSDAQLARALGVGKPTVVRWLEGRGEPSKPEHRERLDLALCVVAVARRVAQPVEQLLLGGEPSLKAVVQVPERWGELLLAAAGQSDATSQLTLV